jgi:hypothetical protein
MKLGGAMPTVTEVKTEPTKSCALLQIQVNQWTSKKSLEDKLAALQEEQKINWMSRGANYGSGATGLFAVTCQGTEPNAEKMLEELLFQKVLSFPRRNGYTPGVLNLWVRKTVIDV